MCKQSAWLGVVCLCIAAACCHAGPSAAPPADYVPDPEVEELLVRAEQPDRVIADKAVQRLTALGQSAERALLWHLNKETTDAARQRWAELYARTCRGRVGYRVILELQPEGGGTVTLWSDRALLAQCGKRYERLHGRPEPVFGEEELRRNPYSKVELIKHLNDGLKFLEGRVEGGGESIAAIGVLNFKSFDPFGGFTESFDPAGYHLLGGLSLTDSDNLRLLRYRKAREQHKDAYQKNLLLFYDVKWEFVLDFKGTLNSNNANRTDGSRLIWTFNCQQMLNGEALIDAAYPATGPARPAAIRDDTIVIPESVQAGQPLALPKEKIVRAKASKRADAQAMSIKEAREKGYIVELDGRNSLPRNQELQYQWTQTYGEDLNLTAEALAKPRIWLRIYEPGEYRFELTISANGQRSKPAEVKVLVDDDAQVAATAPTATPTPDLPPKTATPKTEPKREPAQPKPEPKPEPAQPKPEPKPEPAQPKVEPKPVPPKPAPTQPKVTPPATPEVKPDTGKAAEIYLRAQELLKAFKYAEAKPLLHEASGYNPDDQAIQFDLAIAQMETGEITQAATRFEAVAQANNRPQAFMNVGHCYARGDNLSEARAWYLRGTRLGKEAVQWEPLWQLGNNELRNKEFSGALQLLQDAEKMAVNAKVKDPRLLRDLALAYHGARQDGEALKRVTELQALGYALDAQIVGDIQKGAGPAVANIDTPKPQPKPEPAQPKPEPKPEPAQPKPEPKPEPAQPKPEPKPVTPQPKPEPAQPKPEPKPEPAHPKPEPKPVPAQPKTEPKPAPKVEPAQPKPVPPTPEPPHEPKRKLEPVKRDVKPTVKRPLPPVPDDFDAALLAGKNACEAGVAALTLNTDEGKQNAAEHFDAAEAMLRGAWSKKPCDEQVTKAFHDLAKHAGAIALVRNTELKSKIKGLIVLDAEPSVGPKDKPLYYVWEQVAGEDLNLRPEDMAVKKRGIRIAKAGLYKFELVVSDGVRGGNPVTVTVEVVE